MVCCVLAVLVKLLCIMLPNLERLCHKMNFWMSYLQFFDCTASIQSGFLASLKELRIDWGCDKSGTPLETIGGFLLVLKLEKLHLYGVQGLDDSSQLPICHSVKHLRLTDTCLNAAQFERLVCAFPNLRQLEYHTGGILVADETHEFGASAGVIALRPLAGQLEYLLLDLAEQYKTPDMGRTWVESLEHFSALKELCIESTIILSEKSQILHRSFFAQYFPVTLTSLRITHIYRPIERLLLELAEDLKNWLPDLEQVQLDFGGSETAGRYENEKPVITNEELKVQLDLEYGVNDPQAEIQ